LSLLTHRTHYQSDHLPSKGLRIQREEFPLNRFQPTLFGFRVMPAAGDGVRSHVDEFR
jgi:hypothetical protein